MGIMVVSLSLMLIFSCNQSTTKGPTKKNVLFIIVDDLRPELGCYGVTRIQTPNMDQLAAEGQLFERALCQNPVCGASRASMFTGAYATKKRFRNYNTWVDQDMPESTTLFKHFRNNGYFTASFGKVYHHSDDQINSWSQRPYRRIAIGSYNWRDYVLPENIENATSRTGRRYGVGPAFEKADVHDTVYYDGKMAKAVIKELQKSKTRDKPFCIATGFMKPHLPFNAPAKYWDLYNTDDFNLPPTYEPNESIPGEALHNWGELRAYTNIPAEGKLNDGLAKQLIHGYYACVSYIDAQVGLVLNELERLKLRENTIVVLVGDHGWNLGDHGLWAKHCLFKSSLHTPLILNVPGFKEGKRIKAVTPLTDIYPSLCELTGLDIPPLIEGKSFVDKLKQPASEGTYSYSRYFNGECIATDRYSYVEFNDYKRNRIITGMLFDHAVDSFEKENLYNRMDYIQITDSLRRILRNNAYLNR
jgi:arylsulfatase A-like enzyme